MQPTQRDVHVDAILTGMSIAYFNAARNFIAPRVFPAVTVDKQSDKYYVYPKDAWFRDEAQKRGDSTESVGSGYDLSTDSYFVDVWALHKDIGDQVRRNADPAIDLDADATRFLMQRLMMRMERDWASSFFTTGVWATDLTPANLWSSYTTSDPIADIEVAKEAILLNTGFTPNKLVLGYQVFRQLQHHPDILERYKYTSSEVVTEQLLARLFGVDEVLVARGIVNTGNEGETSSFSFIQGKHALLVYTPPSAGLTTPMAGATFLWRGMVGSIGDPVLIRRFRMEKLRADRVEAELAYDHKVIGSDLGYFFNGAVA
jgi:hypothetical protein